MQHHAVLRSNVPTFASVMDGNTWHKRHIWVVASSIRVLVFNDSVVWVRRILTPSCLAVFGGVWCWVWWCLVGFGCGRYFQRFVFDVGVGIVSIVKKKGKQALQHLGLGVLMSTANTLMICDVLAFRTIFSTAQSSSWNCG